MTRTIFRRMVCGLPLVLSMAGAAWAAPLEGVVFGADGQPAAGAAVHIEPSLEGALLSVHANEAGRFRFDDAPEPPFGIVAVVPGAAYAGRHLKTVPAGAVVLRAGAPVTLRGRVLDAEGKPVAGARILRVAVLGGDAVSVPLSKLQAAGVAVPLSGADGRFEAPGVPAGAMLALKVAHPQFAQEGIGGLRAEAGEAEIRLTPGIVVRGAVESYDEGRPVEGALVRLRSAHPPNDTTLLQSDAAGEFVARLKPGGYGYRAEAPGRASAGWENLHVGGQAAETRLKIFVSPVGRLRGSIKDAASSGPVAGARVVVQTGQSIEAVLRSGADGSFDTAAAAGEYVVIVEPPAGYFPAAAGGTRVRLAAGETLELPGQWLAPIPPYRIQLVDEAGAPVSRCVVTLVRPYQFGWHLADAEGRVTLEVAQLPPDGRILGLAEHLDQPLGALFVLTRESETEGRAQLLPLGQVSGRVAAARNRPIEGAIVGALFPGETDADLTPLWRTVTDGDGRFAWHAVVPGLPQRCLVRVGGADAAESPAFSLAAGGAQDLGTLGVERGDRARSLVGERIDWRGFRRQTGPEPAAGARPAVLFYAGPDEAEATYAGAATVQRIAGDRLDVALIADGAFAPPDAALPIYQGRRSGPAATYVLDAEGRVVLATFGLPPASALRRAAGAAQ